MKLRPHRLTEVSFKEAEFQLESMLAEIATAPNRNEMEVERLSLSYRLAKDENIGVTPRQPLLSAICGRILDPVASSPYLEHAAGLNSLNSRFALQRSHNRLGQRPISIVVIKGGDEYPKHLPSWLRPAKRMVVNDPLSPNAGDFGSGRQQLAQSRVKHPLEPSNHACCERS
ncbi:hypothetical protein [Methylocystis hirsuta]|uniref:hypothetical protein n=1 Tax=Methylocystis hirsuta TaxID=369798 RepID=UPI001FDFAC18|nr:hypothetical protein [Methylocystis hirsuta]